ncbi:MAG: radical SAM protein [Desulfomonilia bacterium]
MKESGFATIRLGLETSDPALQEATGGKISNDEFLRALENLTRAGFDPSDIGVYILCGLPGQHAREVLDAVEFVRSSGARPVIAEYSPLPGTGMWDEALRMSRYPLDEDPLFHNNTLLPCAWEGLDLSMYRDIRLAAARGASSAEVAGEETGTE